MKCKQVTLIATTRFTLKTKSDPIIILFFSLDSVLTSISEQTGMYKNLCIIHMSSTIIL